MLRRLPSHESYGTVDGSIADPVELDEAERHLQYLVQGESFNIERKDLLDNKSFKKSSRIAQFTPFIGPHGLIRSSGRIRRLVKIDFDTKHPIVLDARQGGIWERLVCSFKRVVYTILGTRRLTDEVLNTTFCLVEYALNSRPLTPVSARPT